MEPKIEPWIKEVAKLQRQAFEEFLSKALSFKGELPTPEQFEKQLAGIIAQHAPSSPAAPTPHMNAAEFRKTYMGAPLVIGNAMDQDAVYRFAEAYAAYQTARADRAEQELARNKPSGFKDLAEWKTQWEILCESSVKETYKLIAAEADLQRKDAALKLISKMNHSPTNHLRLDILDICARCCAENALAPLITPEVTPSPCCANPKMVANGVCRYDNPIFLDELALCSDPDSWRPTHNVCLNCGKEEKI